MQNQEAHCRNWCSFVSYFGADPELQDTPSGFGGLSQTVYFGRGKQVQSITVSGAITDIGKKIALAHQINPTKMPHSDKLLPRLQEMLVGFHKEYPETNKKSPEEVDVPEYLTELGRCDAASQLLKLVGDNSLMAYYYLLRVGDYSYRIPHQDLGGKWEEFMCGVHAIGRQYCYIRKASGGD